MTGRAMKPSSDIMLGGKIDDPPDMSNPASIGDSNTNEVDQFVFDQFVTIPDRVENLADCDGRGRMLADQPKRVLIFGRCRVF